MEETTVTRMAVVVVTLPKYQIETTDAHERVSRAYSVVQISQLLRDINDRRDFLIKFFAMSTSCAIIFPFAFCDLYFAHGENLCGGNVSRLTSPQIYLMIFGYNELVLICLVTKLIYEYDFEHETQLVRVKYLVLLTRTFLRIFGHGLALFGIILYVMTRGTTCDPIIRNYMLCSSLIKLGASLINCATFK